ncbi:hypothetical protein [Shouchella lehensis]|uniref:Uncharacterized protein n=1 Tax=Shouchella lehensis G1 TaxID=1246626 RepID=A0A060LZV8_9BACI|nr:hypothetical protein [Shouchella lehensis]AIC93349.1 hypothetical protein BleG1_0741 [Shouchella lehensis G1]
MKENGNRGLLTAILVCLILLVLGFGNNGTDMGSDFPQQIETFANEDQVLSLGDDKIIIHTSYNEIIVLQWNIDTQTFEKIQTYDYMLEE